MVRTVARVQGITLILLAVSSLLIGGNALHGVLHIALMENLIHLLTGGLLVWVGVTHSEKRASLTVAILSALFLLLGIPAVLSSGIVANDYSLVHKVIRLAIGVIGVAAILVSRVRQRGAVHA